MSTHDRPLSCPTCGAHLEAATNVAGESLDAPPKQGVFTEAGARVPSDAELAALLSHRAVVDAVFVVRQWIDSKA